MRCSSAAGMGERNITKRIFLHHNSALALRVPLASVEAMSLKITLVGAGSVVFAKNLIGDILQFPELSDATICLMDIDPARLKVAKVMAEKMVAALRVKAKIVATLDRREAVKGARYVICTIQVGGYKPGTVIDFEIPRKYGLLQTIGDTLGVGGVFRALRTIPEINKVARDIAEVGAPGCLLLNYTNPMAMNCMAVDRAVGIPHVGLCHSVQGTSKQLAGFAGLPYDDVSYLVAGINHMAFFLKFDYRGQDAYPLLFRALDDPKRTQEKVRFEMMRRTGYFVTESSEHQSEYVPYFIHHGKKVIDQFDVPIDEYLRRCKAIIGTWEKTEAELLGKGDAPIQVNPQSHEYGSFIIHSRETNTPRVVYGNVPNRNLITNLPARACVELPVLVDAQGLQPTHVGALPPQLAALCQTNINVQDLTVEAALTGKREHVYHAVMLDPHTATVLPLDKIWAMCDELIAAHQKAGLLGEFAPVIPNTGRAWKGTGDRLLAEVKVSGAYGKQASLQAEVGVTNPGREKAAVRLQVGAQALGGPKGEARTVRLDVPAGKTAWKKVSLPRPAGAAESGLAVTLEGDSARVLARGYVARPRPVLASKGGAGAPFSLALAGFPAVEGSIGVRQGKVVLRASVDDSKVTPAPEPWEGSCLELFFMPLAGGPIRQVFVVPQRGLKQAKLFGRMGRDPHPGAARVRPAAKGAGYEVEVELPLASVGLREGEFLFDLYARLTALGDAHSGGRTSLSGHFESHSDSSHFVRVAAE